MAAQSILYALPTRDKLVEFVIEAIHSVPGVLSAGLCLRGYSGPRGDIDESCHVCPNLKYLSNDIDRFDFPCGFSGMDNVSVFSLATSIRQYGFLQIRNDGSGELVQIRPFIINFANAVAITMENQWQRENLESVNAELENHRNNLEALVEERTEEINTQKIQLKTYATELESANDDLRDFIHMASHDLQEPMRKIMIYGDLLESESQNFKEKEKTYLKKMENASSRMHQLMNDLQHYSKVTSQIENSFETVNLEEILKQVLSDLEILIKESGGKVEVGNFPTIQANCFLMGILFQNLIANSLKYCKKNVSPLIKVGVPPVSPQDGKLEIRVEDNGIGFDGKFRDRIFKPFERLHGKNEYAGTGIGLAICKRIVERHKGTITASSKNLEGAVFIIKLPLGHPEIEK